MSDALNILNARLAKGEISESEHTRLTAKLSAPQPAPAKTPDAKSGGKWLGFAGVVIVIAIISNLASEAKQGRTHINNLRSSGFFGDIITGELLTQGKSGTTYAWIEKGGKKMCPRRVFLQQNRPRKFEFRCSKAINVKGRTFTMKTNRQPEAWIKRNALSL